ncbi:hypothetical protein D9X30_1691 (plasmid) [Cupriavidus sp. U2]|nr:XRE family transcriptional regulator [Cupriavidus sp. U2]KAI3593381.1 hypothetical protein D9X30_1691 [Cupriavidus sp. U2]
MAQMADRLKRSASFLSSVETGRKSIPESLIEDVVREYGLAPAAASELSAAAARSATVFRIEPAEQDQELVATFARKLDTLSDEQRKRIFNILKS